MSVSSYCTLLWIKLRVLCRLFLKRKMWFILNKNAPIRGHVRLLRTIRLLDNLSFLFILQYFVEATLLYLVPLGRYCRVI